MKFYKHKEFPKVGKNGFSVDVFAFNQYNEFDILCYSFEDKAWYSLVEGEYISYYFEWWYPQKEVIERFKQQ